MEEQEKQQEIKPKKKHSFIFKLFKFFLVLVAIILVILSIIKLVSWIKEKRFDDLIRNTALIDEIGDLNLTEQEKAEDWNNDGISNEEAESRGLNLVETDSDGDGLSDYDEIYKYFTDPTKYSTSGDIYSDGYKLKNGYDLNKQYETKKDITISNSDIVVEVDDAHDMAVYYKEYSGKIPEGYILGYNPFRLYSFSGKVTLAINSPENYEVISYDNLKKKTTKIKSKVENGKLVFEVSNDNPILIVYNDKALKLIDENAYTKLVTDYSNDIDKEYFVVAFPLFTYFLEYPVYILEVDNNLSDYEAINKLLIDDINEKSGGKFKVEHRYTNSLTAKVLDYVFGGITKEMANNLTEGNTSFINYIILYGHLYSKEELYNYLLGDITKKEEEEARVNEFEKKYNNKNCTYCADSGFNVNINAFSFANFSTVKTGGVCAGFARITTNIFNNGKLNKEQKSKYDLTDYSYNVIWAKKLFEYNTGEYLSPYGDEIYGNEETLDINDISGKDGEVVKAIQYHWEDFNNDIRMKKFGWAWNNASDKMTYISSSTVDNLVEKFKKGEIVSVLLLSEGQHAVNAYKIVEDKDDEDILYVKIYDNNFPSDKFWTSDAKSKQKYDITLTLKRVYENGLFGTKTKYLYSYNPIGRKSYSWGNVDMSTDGILFIDENNKAL